MKRNALFLLTNSIFMLFLLTLLPGCNKIIDWGKDNFYQGEKVEKDIDIARNYLKSQRVYDQFTISGHFDALWLSDEVRKVYTDIYCKRRSKTDEQKQIFLRRQLEENNHFITFYLLSLQHIVLGEAESTWSISLKVGDKSLNPVKIKTIDLSPEYLDIFGKKYNKFKDVYLVYFNAKDVEDNYIINEQTDNITLLFRSVDKELLLSWDLKK